MLLLAEIFGSKKSLWPLNIRAPSKVLPEANYPNLPLADYPGINGGTDWFCLCTVGT